MLKNTNQLYTKGIMKTLDAHALKAHKENLHAEFEKVKAEAVSYENLIQTAQEKRTACIGKMAELKGAFKTISDLERQLGVTPTLLGKTAKGGTATPQ